MSESTSMMAARPSLAARLGVSDSLKKPLLGLGLGLGLG